MAGWWVTLLRVGSPAEPAVASDCDVQQPFVLSQPVLLSTEPDLAAMCSVDPRLSEGHLFADRDFRTSSWGGLKQIKFFQPQTHSLPSHKDPSSRANLQTHSRVSPVLSRMLWIGLSVHENQTCFSFRERLLLSFPDTVSYEDVLCYQSSCYHLSYLKSEQDVALLISSLVM